MIHSIEEVIQTPHSVRNRSTLPTKIHYRSISISDLKFENQTNEATVSPGSKIYGRLYLNIQPNGRQNCLRQVLIGIKDRGPQKFDLFRAKDQRQKT